MRLTMSIGCLVIAILGVACSHNPPAYTRGLPLLLARSDSTPAGRLLTLETRLRAILYREGPQRPGLAGPYLDSIRMAKIAFATLTSVSPDTAMDKLSTWQYAAHQVSELLNSPERLRSPSGKRRLQDERLAFEDYCHTVVDSLLCAPTR